MKDDDDSLEPSPDLPSNLIGRDFDEQLSQNTKFDQGEI